MSQTASLLLGFAAGAGLGAAYLAVLWWCIRRLAAARSPGAWMLATAAARIALVVGGFWLLLGLGPAPMVAGVGGFLLVRVLVTGRVRTTPPQERAQDAGPSRSSGELAP